MTVAEDGAGPLTPERATAEALAALKAAGLGKEHGKPFTVRSRHYGRVPLHTGPECVLTEVIAAKAAHLDDAAMRALFCLPGGVVYGEQGRLVSIYREVVTPETQRALPVDPEAEGEGVAIVVKQQAGLGLSGRAVRPVPENHWHRQGESNHGPDRSGYRAPSARAAA